jgi:lipopolysaccharide/colanic/teichoic acid biosynthesis glycosyltransferase
VILPETSKKKKKIVVTGASGFVGKQLVPILLQSGAQILLVGRNTEKLSLMFPSISRCSYEDIEQKAQDYDILVHLATLNNDSKADLAAFEAANKDFLLSTAEHARRARIPLFVNVSSIHALDHNNKSAYAQSKRVGAESLSSSGEFISTTIYLPLVYSCTAQPDSLAFLNYLPKNMSDAIFCLIAAIKPTVNIEKLAAYLLRDDLGSDTKVILSDDQNDNRVFVFLKRAIDVGCSLLISIFLSWLMLAIWIIVRLSSNGPGIFAQQRIGKNGKPFTCYKFRTMSLGAPNAASHETPASFVTPAGKALRKYKLDELPQIINVLLNDMSLIGPRPCLPIQLELIKARRNLDTLDLKPGISGLAQVNNIDMRNPNRLAEWDAKYKKLRCLDLEMKIILATVLGRGTGDQIAVPSNRSHL